jgi:hypothetical protein
MSVETKENFEFHLTVHPDSDTLLYAFAQHLQKTVSGRVTNEVVKPRATYPRELYGKHPRQPMLTGNMYGTISLVKQRVLDLAQDMRNYGINVVRTKIEALASTTYVEHKTYFESHFKINTERADQYNEVALLVLPAGGHVSYNIHDRVPLPIVTFRVYDSAETLYEVTDSHIQKLKNLGYDVAQNAHYECAVYDDNVLLDSDWIFEGTDTTRVITDPSKIVLFPILLPNISI